MAGKQLYDVYLFKAKVNPGWPFLPSRIIARWKNCTDLKEYPQKFNGVTFVTAGGIFTAIEYNAEDYTIGICYLGVVEAKPAEVVG